MFQLENEWIASMKTVLPYEPRSRGPYSCDEAGFGTAAFGTSGFAGSAGLASSAAVAKAALIASAVMVLRMRFIFGFLVVGRLTAVWLRAECFYRS